MLVGFLYVNFCMCKCMCKKMYTNTRSSLDDFIYSLNNMPT